MASVKKTKHELPERLKHELAESLAPDNNFISVKHFPNLGDIVSIMPALKRYWEITGKRIKFCQQIDTPSAYYPGASHPTVDANGQMVSLNQEMFTMMQPFMESQEYIHSFEVYKGQPINLDLDVIRDKVFVGMPNLMIQSWIMYAYPDLQCDISVPWVKLEGKCPIDILEQVKGKVILNFTERYRNHLIDYNFLKGYAPDLIFAGTEREHFLFCHKWQLNIPRLQVKDFLDYGYAIKNSRFLLGCQSFGWNICQSLHHPRIVELCRYAPNIQPFIGKDSFGFFHQVGAEWSFKELYNKTIVTVNKKAP